MNIYKFGVVIGLLLVVGGDIFGASDFFNIDPGGPPCISFNAVKLSTLLRVMNVTKNYNLVIETGNAFLGQHRQSFHADDQVILEIEQQVQIAQNARNLTWNGWVKSWTGIELPIELNMKKGVWAYALYKYGPSVGRYAVGKVWGGETGQAAK